MGLLPSQRKGWSPETKIFLFRDDLWGFWEFSIILHSEAYWTISHSSRYILQSMNSKNPTLLGHFGRINSSILSGGFVVAPLSHLQGHLVPIPPALLSLNCTFQNFELFQNSHPPILTSKLSAPDVFFFFTKNHKFDIHVTLQPKRIHQHLSEKVPSRLTHQKQPNTSPGVPSTASPLQPPTLNYRHLEVQGFFRAISTAQEERQLGTPYCKTNQRWRNNGKVEPWHEILNRDPYSGYISRIIPPKKTPKNIK